MIDIQDFKYELFRGGTLSSNHGHLILSSPKLIKDKFPDTKPLILRANKFFLPGVWLTTDDMCRRYGYGPIDKTPHLAQFDPFQIELIADENGFVQDYFYTWINRIANFDFSDGIKGSSGGGFAYEQAYKKDFITDIVVRSYKNNTDTCTTYNIIRAWPSSIDAVPIVWEETNSVVRIRVTFMYQDWNMEVSDSVSFETDSVGKFIPDTIPLRNDITIV